MSYHGVSTYWHGIQVSGSVYHNPGGFYEPPGCEFGDYAIELDDPEEFAEAGWIFLENLAPGVERMVHAFQRITGRFAPGVEETILRDYSSDLEEALADA